ncbi:hypothetical protein PSI9734_00830 [Pseudidiomarina piscicola]|uniref:Uncharacterized protein n=1 Tax=Pseudidiomarina piscicola TaxID=2614830 RepID=A0A6S6WQY5_9GAMM|nr:hypothetical protein [Pseudidiomarina piscicola]CAB0150276.1 hypothetical protein PSI9734_00830 [Pseudidiomarina piscicola]VZT39705.1 hypothetical protein PSI9734_00830 [Pseudomonas aeruginosa]
MPNRYGFITHIALLFLITLLARPVSAQDTTTHFTLTAPESSREGYFVVSLDQAPQPGMVLQQSSNPNFSVITAEFVWFGDFEKMTLTGFSNGDYYFRIAPSAEVASNSVAVKVRHYPAWQAYTLFFIGLALFSLLVVTIIVLHRTRSRESNRGPDD